MQKIDIHTKIAETAHISPNTKMFLEIGDLTALRKDPSGKFYRSNYNRGILLYSLITKYKPKTILEFGTGRGYGALSMAKAIIDSNLDSHIYTIDYRRFDEKQTWPIDYGKGPEVISASLKDIWTKYFSEKLTDKITMLHGTSKSVTENWNKKNMPAPDFAFIDGGHDYLSVKHDYYATLSVSNNNFRILFDDYVQKSTFGICKLVDEEIQQTFNTEVISSYSEYHSIHKTTQNHSYTKMILIDSSNLKSESQMPIIKINAEKFLRTYRNPNIIKKALLYLKKTKLLQTTVGPIWRYLKEK